MTNQEVVLIEIRMERDDDEGTDIEAMLKVGEIN